MKDPLAIMLDMTPPTVSIPKERGVASIMTSPSVSSDCSPQIIPPYTAAPKAKASSGLIPVFGSFPLKKSFTSCLILGIRVDPPTKTISSISYFLSSDYSRASQTGPRDFLKRSLLSSSNLALVIDSSRLTPSTRSSISIVTSCWEERALLVFSTSLFNFYMALLSALISTYYFFFKSLIK